MSVLKKAALALTLALFCVHAAQAADALKIGSLPAADSLILHAAQKDGVFAAHGLDVEVVPFQSALELGPPPCAQARSTVTSATSSTCSCRTKTARRRSLWPTTSHSSPKARFFGLAVSPKSSAESLADLKGKTCSIGRATIVDFVLDSLLAQEGAAGSLEKRDIRQIPVRLQMLLSGQIESALLPEPLLSLVEGQGARVLLDDRKLDMPLAVIALRKPDNADDPAFADRIRALPRSAQGRGRNASTPRPTPTRPV